jgi:DNA polymerase-1
VLTIRNNAGHSIELDFDEIIFADFEFIAPPGERPDVVCLAWHEYTTGITRTLWADELGSLPPYRTDARALFACFVANAEIGCHLSRNWPVPKNIIDLHAEFRRLTNGCIVPAGKGLIGACTYFGIDTISSKQKDETRNRIMQGWPFSDEEKAKILDYAKGDVDGRLLSEILPLLNMKVALLRGKFVGVLAKMEHRGVPLDMEYYPQIADAEAWAHVRDAMVPEIDREYGVYVRDKKGDWAFNQKLFEEYLKRNCIVWPRLETGKLDLKRKTFEDMCKSVDGLENLRQLRHTRDKMRKIKLSVGADGCNRTTLWPFKSKSSRTQPKAAQWIFSPAVWLRCLIKPGPGNAVAYVDYSSMEFMVGAALSGDPVMIEFYQSGDPYLMFAIRVGAAPPWATKHTHAELRDRYKIGLLAIQYGISEHALAARLGISVFAAREMINQHKQLFAVYWAWVDDWINHAFDHGIMWTPFDWQCRVGITEFNARSIGNFPVQATSADALRLAIVMADRQGLDLRGPVHDALLLHAPIERIEADTARLQDIMRRASRLVLNDKAEGRLELRSDAKIIRYPDRFEDKRGIDLWRQVARLLGEYQRRKDQRRG